MACFTGFCCGVSPSVPPPQVSYILTRKFVPSDPSLSAVFLPPKKFHPRILPPPAEKLKSFAAIADWESGSGSRSLRPTAHLMLFVSEDA